jgi:hypothetical protein
MRVLFDAAVFLGAFLLFFVQPLIAKRLLPWFGGGPAVWSACLMFFQAALVAGYGYAHVARRLGTRRQVLLHAVLLGLAMFALPIVPPEAMKPADGTDPVWRLLAILTRTVGAPFVLLAATAPLLQDWFAASMRGRSPYFLYVISNVGALAALLCYPTLVEPATTLDVQSRWWSVAFVVFAMLASGCGWLAARQAAPAAAVDVSPGSTEDGAGPALTDRVLWPLLPAAGTAVLVATTNQLSQDVAALPLIWIAPLALYLLSYIAGFAGWYRRTIVGAVMIASIAAALYAIETEHGWSLRVQVTWLLAALTFACLFCHGELSRVKPSPRHLTAFYFQISVGGAIGGIFVSIGAPLLFDRFVELPLILLAVVALLFFVVVRDLPAASRWPRRAALGAFAGTIVLAGLIVADRDRWSFETYRHRNFYGVLRVREEPATTPLAMRMLYHGRVMHGGQFLDPSRQLAPSTYYGRGNGIASAITGHPRRLAGGAIRVGAIGLGTGTLAAWGQPGDLFRFYEIDPAVVDVAIKQFSFLDESPADVEVVLGDARLAIERELRDPARQTVYDVLAVDAFSGDAIPIHLLTRESFALYRQALAPDGVIAVHVSNRYLDLRPVVYGLADDAHLTVIPFALSPVPAVRAPGSTWLLLTTNAEFIERTPGLPDVGPPDPRRIIWTDDFSSLISVLR